MVDPQYQELLKADIPNVSKDGVHVAVIAGEALGTSVSCCLPSMHALLIRHLYIYSLLFKLKLLLHIWTSKWIKELHLVNL